MRAIGFVDFDDTPYDTGKVLMGIRQDLEDEFGPAFSEKFDLAYEQVRSTIGKVDIPLTLSQLTKNKNFDYRFRRNLAEIVKQQPYGEYYHRSAEAALGWIRSQVDELYFLSDGDQLFQRYKIESSGLSTLVNGVIVVPSKVDILIQLEAFYPAEHYLFLDDKGEVLDWVKMHFGNRATTCHVRQGKYANKPMKTEPDRTFNTIGEVIGVKFF